MQPLKNIIPEKSQYILGFIILALVIISSLITIFDGIKDLKQNKEDNTSSCNTVLIKINGELVEYKSDSKDTWTDETVSDDVLTYLDNAESDSTIKAVILEINSGGGSPIGGQKIANALKRMTKPTIALIESTGLSATYWASTGASRIYASNLSDVGDIGIINEVWDQVNKDKQDGYTYNVLTSAKYKALGDSHIPLTQNGKGMLMVDIMKAHNIFVDEVSINRHLNRNIVAKLADGSSMMGADALKMGLIDQVGDMFDVKNYLADKIGKSISECEY